MREAGTGLKAAWRLQITGAGLGPRLANSIRSQTYPEVGREPGRGGAGLVESAGHRRRGKGSSACNRSPGSIAAKNAPIFLLVPQVKLPKRLNLARDADRALENVPGLIVANWVEGKW